MKVIKKSKLVPPRKGSPHVIHEDSEIFIVGKPSGWITNEADTTTNQPVLQTWVAKTGQWPLATDNKFRSGIVHRLDKETSGVLIVAKTKDSFINLQKQFKDRLTKKEYVALAHGKVDPPGGSIDMPVGRLPWNRRRFGVLPGGREAFTSYETTRNYTQEKEHYTLLRLKPRTGRTHQIRIHLKHIRHAVVSDEFYAGRKTARNDRKWCPRLFLHAAKITFTHPKSGKEVSFEAPLPPDLKKILSTLSISKDL